MDANNIKALEPEVANSRFLIRKKACLSDFVWMLKFLKIANRDWGTAAHVGISSAKSWLD
jgi:hypothetical protein